MIGSKILHYEILEQIGEGGMGVVYKAQDTSLNRFVALKFLPTHLTRNEASRKRFVVEAQATSALDHPNICKIHEINETKPAPGEAGDSQLYICMAYYEGESLRQRVEKGPIPFDEAVGIIIQIAEGLQAAHEKKIIHRDIKPGNILITKKGEAKIVDFGLAKLAGVDLTKSTSSIGTAAYMCPEQIRGQEVDHRCDIWALGIVFYELLTAHLPFEGVYPEAMMYSIVNAAPKGLSYYLKNVPETAQSVIDKLLQKDPAERYQEMPEVLEELQPLATTGESTAIKRRPILGKRLRWKRASVYGGVALLIFIAVLFMVRPYLFPKSGSKKIAVLPFESITKDAEREWFTDGMTDQLITSLAGISDLNVISRRSVIKYKATNKAPPEIAAELGVQYLVEASVLGMAEDINISARLINAPDDEVIWAKTYERDFTDVRMLFGELAQDIADEIEAKLTSQDRERLASLQPVDPEAYELYLKGKFYLEEWSHADIRTAINYFTKALELDSNFALAHVGLGMCNGFFTYHGVLSREEGLARIKTNINSALELDENLAEAYYLQGAFRLWQLWDWAGAGESFKRMKELNPNLSAVMGTEYAWYLITMGRFDELMVEAQRLLQADPFSYLTRGTVINAYYYARRYDRSIEICQRIIQQDPMFTNTHWYLANNYEQLKQHDDAHQSRLSAMELSRAAPEDIAAYDSLYRELGPKAYSTWQLMSRKNQKEWLNNNPVSAARIYTILGEKEKALDYLEKAYEKRDGPLTTINVSPRWDPLRAEPRFRDLLRRMNFPM